ncbi:MAG: hypothetical protein O2887_16845 [Bacteroidetes bacterium]|nr:hypothetical protein [Bacteroidota bacterium]MDA1122129.1 hypothetical protein [Bacteroidota bacterium]
MENDIIILQIDTLRLHFTSLEEYAVNQLYLALSIEHEVSSSPNPIPEICDFLVVGSKTGSENSDVIAASKNGIGIISAPQLIYLLCQDKQRIVIAGSFGKSAIAQIVIHVLEFIGKDFDYAILSPLVGKDLSVKISDAPLIILEGSELPCSKFNRGSQFLQLQHHVLLITNLADKYDDRYSKFEKFVKQFDNLADATPKGGTVIFSEDDDLVTIIGSKERDDVKSIPFLAHLGELRNGLAILQSDTGEISIPVEDEFAFSHFAGAKVLLKILGVTDDQFYEAIKSYGTK